MAFPIGWANKQKINIDLSVLEGTIQPFFLDDFNRADSSTITDSNWAANDSGGYLSIKSNKLDFLATSTTSILSSWCSVSNDLTKDFEVFFTSKFESDTVLSSTGQHFCRLTVADTSGNYWYVDHRYQSDGTYVIYAGSNNGDLAPITTGILATEIIKLVRVGTLISVFHLVNGFWVLLGDITNLASTATIYTQQVRWWCWNDNGTYHGTVDDFTINTQQPTTFNETNFPVKLTGLDIDGTSFSQSLTDGADWRFTADEVGQEPLDFYIDSANITNHTCLVFTELPSITSSLDSIWLWFNNPSASTVSNDVTVWKDPQAATEMLTFQQPPLFDRREVFNDLTTNAWGVNFGSANVINGALDFTDLTSGLDLWARAADITFTPGSNGEDFEVYQDYNLIDCTGSGSDYVQIRIGIVTYANWSDFFQIWVELRADGTLHTQIANQTTLLAGYITLPVAKGTVRFARKNGELKVYYWNPSSKNWEWEGSSAGFTLKTADANQYFIREIFHGSASTSIHATLTNITVSSYTPRSEAWNVLKQASLEDLTGFLSSSSAQAAWKFTFGNSDLQVIPDRQIINTLAGVIANVDSDTALGTPSQQNVSYSGSAFVCSWADGSIRLKGTRVWHGVSDIGPFWNTSTNTLSNGTATDFGTAFFALHYNDGGIYQYGVSGAQSAYVVELSATYLLTSNTQLGLYQYPSDMVSVSAACDYGTTSNPAPILSYISTNGDLVCASSANNPPSYRAYDLSVTNILKTGLPNSADSISQASILNYNHVIVWSEYVTANKYALKLMKHKEDVYISNDFSGWGGLTHWNSEVALLDGSTDYITAVGDFRYISASKCGIGALMWRSGTTLKYRIFNSEDLEITSGTLSTILPGTEFGFTGGLLYIPTRRVEFHFYYLKDNGDSTSDLALTKIKLTNIFTDYEPNLGTWPVEVSPEEISIPALSLRTFRISCEIKNPMILSVMYHDSLNNLCMLKEQFWDFWQVNMHMGGADLACVGAPTYYGLWAPHPVGPVNVLVAAQWMGSLYINIINSDTGQLKWAYPKRLNNKISDNHQATYAYIDSSGHVWLVGRGRVGAPESAALLVRQSNKPISDPDFSADVSLWYDKNPGIAAGRGYKTIESDQWGNIYVFWQYYGNMGAKIYSYKHQAWSQEIPLVVSDGDNWPDDFRWRSRKIVKDIHEHLHLFYGLRSKEDAPVTASRGAFYMRIIPKDFSYLTTTEFQNTIDPPVFFDCVKADSTPMPLPHDTTELISSCDCILKSTSANAHTPSWGDAMITHAVSSTVSLGQGIYDLTQEHCYVATDFTTTVTSLTTFDDLSDFTMSGGGATGVTAANGICDIDLTSFSGTVDITGTFNTSLTGDFDIRFDFEIITGTAGTTDYSSIGLHVNPSGSYWTNYASIIYDIDYATTMPRYSKNSNNYSFSTTKDTSGTLRLTRQGSILRAFFWDNVNAIWRHFPDGIKVTGQTIGTSDVDLSFWAKKADSSTWHVTISNFKSYPVSGLTAATKPTAFSTDIAHNATIVDNEVIWTEYALFIDGFVRAYDWAGDLLNPAKPVAGLNLDESTRDFVGEAPPLGTYNGSGFPWFVYETDRWVIHHRNDYSYRPTRMGMTNNNIGDIFISAYKDVVNTKGYNITMPIALKTSDCETWEEVPFGLDPDKMDSDIGSWYNSPLGYPVGTDTTLAIAEQFGQFTFFDTLQILKTAGLTTEFLGLFQGNFGGYF